MSPSARERYFAVVEGELAKERAHALRRVGDRLDDAADRCTRLLALLDAGSTTAAARGAPEVDTSPGPAGPADPEATSRPEVWFDRPAEGRASLLEQYRAARLEFQEAKSWLCLQREAIGLHEHRWVDRLYPDPPRR